MGFHIQPLSGDDFLANLAPFSFATFSLACKNDEYTHILLILPVSAGLIFLQRDSILQSARSNFAAGGSCGEVTIPIE